MSSFFGAWIVGEAPPQRRDHLAGLVDRERRLRDVGEPGVGREVERSASCSTDSTSTIESGASPIVPTTSSWPAWPIRIDRVAVGGVAARLHVHLRHERAGRVDRAQAARGRRSRAPTARRRERRRRRSRPPAPRSPRRRRPRRAPRGRGRRAGCGRSACARRPAAPYSSSALLDRLDGALDPGAVAAGRGEEHFLNHLEGV